MSEDRCKCGAPVSKNEAAFYACGSPIKPRHDVYPHSSECYERQLSQQAQEIGVLKKLREEDLREFIAINKQLTERMMEIEQLKSQIIDLNMQINSPVTCLAALKAVEEGK